MTTNTLLWDANACVGRGPNAAAGYPRAADLLAQMNRLGVDRAVVWHAAAVMHHLPTVNATLLREIARTPGAKGRLLPALAVSPMLLYEPGAVDRLRALMTREGIRALRFPSARYGHTLRQLEPLLAQLRALKPVVFVQHNDPRPEDVLAVAGNLPEVSFVLAQAMWPHYINLFDLMRRRRNVYAESSWLHTWNAIEIIVREFGADRLIFGMGGAAHNGAAIAALMSARISDADRARIAHGNLAHLLALPAAGGGRTRRGPARLWDRLLAGRRLGVPTIDAHYHLGASAGYVSETNDLREQIAATLAEADRLGIETVVASGLDALMGDTPLKGNLSLAAALKPCRGRIRPYFGFNPRFADELAPALNRVMGDFAGFKTLCDYWSVPVTDPRFEPMLKYADEWRLPILYHTWDGQHDSPAMLKDIVKAYPHAVFLLGHSGGGDRGRAEATELAEQNANVVLEWCGSFCSSVPWEQTLARIGSGKVVFGTDGYLHGVPWELGRLLSLPVPDAKLVPILGANMAHILAGRRSKR